MDRPNALDVDALLDLVAEHLRERGWEYRAGHRQHDLRYAESALRGQYGPPLSIDAVLDDILRSRYAYCAQWQGAPYTNGRIA